MKTRSIFSPLKSLANIPLVLGTLAIGFFVCLGGCATNAGHAPDAFAGLAKAQPEARPGRHIAAAPGQDDASGPPAIVNNEPIGYDELFAQLAEVSGKQILAEIVLDRQLQREFARRNLQLEKDAIEHEKQLLALSLTTRMGLDDRAIGQLLTRLRADRGLGPIRYAALLRRNAMLRALAGPRVQVTPAQVELAWRIRHGQRVRIRIIVTHDAQDAASIRSEIHNGPESQIEARFIQQAIAHSTDASASRGGLIEPLSPADPAYEDAIREAIKNLAQGQLSPVIAIRTGYAICYMQARIAPDGVELADIRDSLAHDLRIRSERLMMDELATQLLNEATLSVHDPSLRWSWQSSGGG